jgi:DNA-binding LacI/PurR family transcriptional regulator
LATEIGVSHATARKAVQVLLDSGLLCRLESGRLAVPRSVDPEARKLHAQIALLVPAWESSVVTRWQVAMGQLCDRFKCSFRTVHYGHWDDPLILSSLENFDGAFFLPVPEPMPSHFMPSFLRLRRRVVMLDNDWSQHGVPSMQLFPPVFTQKLLDHLESLGHRKIDCVNVQPVHPLITARIAQWRVWRMAHEIDGQLVDDPVDSYTETIPAAYELIDRRIRNKEFDCTAMLCMTERVAAGAMRAMLDHGIRPGHDVAVCIIDDGGRAEYCNPSLTSLVTPDPAPYLSVCLEWMLGGEEQKWQGPLLVQPDSVELAVRQSTVPGIDEQTAPRRRPMGKVGT